MKACVQTTYNVATANLEIKDSSDAYTLEDLKKTDYFDQVQKRIKKVREGLDLDDLAKKFANFDTTDTGCIPAYALVNTLKHNYEGLFQE